MDKQFDELSKSLAEGVSRREVLRKIGVGLAGVLLAAVGLRSRAWAGPSCSTNADCGLSAPVCCGGICIQGNSDLPCQCTTPCPPGTTCQKVEVFCYQKRKCYAYRCV